MPVELDRVDDRLLERVPFGRNRFLRIAAAALTAVAVRMVTAETAEAAHGNPPGCCFGFGVCHCCSGSSCCESRCSWPGGSHSHCPSGAQCWYTCCGNRVQTCCDWHCGTCANGHCICAKTTQQVC